MKRFLMVALAVALSACGSDNNSVTPTVSLFGNYSLRTVNGFPLPFTFSDGSSVTSDVLTLNSDGTFTEDEQLADGQVLVFTGIYTQNNGSLRFIDDGSGFTFSGSVSGSILTVIFNNNTTEVFQKDN